MKKKRRDETRDDSNDEIERRRLRPIEEMEGNGGDRIAIEEDQNEDFWSLLVDLYTEEKLALKRSLN
jgi:hypothetical protein